MVVFCEEAQELERLKLRDNCTEAEARSKIAAQMPLARKIAAADILIDNTADKKTLEGNVTTAWAAVCANWL